MAIDVEEWGRSFLGAGLIVGGALLLPWLLPSGYLWCLEIVSSYGTTIMACLSALFWYRSATIKLPPYPVADHRADDAAGRSAYIAMSREYVGALSRVGTANKLAAAFTAVAAAGSPYTDWVKSFGPTS